SHTTDGGIPTIRSSENEFFVDEEVCRYVDLKGRTGHHFRQQCWFEFDGVAQIHDISCNQVDVHPFLVNREVVIRISSGLEKVRHGKPGVELIAMPVDSSTDIRAEFTTDILKVRICFGRVQTAGIKVKQVCRCFESEGELHDFRCLDCIGNIR